MLNFKNIHTIAFYFLVAQFKFSFLGIYRKYNIQLRDIYLSLIHDYTINYVKIKYILTENGKDEFQFLIFEKPEIYMSKNQITHSIKNLNNVIQSTKKYSTDDFNISIIFNADLESKIKN